MRRRSLDCLSCFCADGVRRVAAEWIANDGEHGSGERRGYCSRVCSGAKLFYRINQLQRFHHSHRRQFSFVAAMQYSSIASWTIGDTHNTYNPVIRLLLPRPVAASNIPSHKHNGRGAHDHLQPEYWSHGNRLHRIRINPGTAISVDQLATGGNGSAQTTWTTSATSATGQANELLISCGGKPGTNVTAISPGGELHNSRQC